MENASKELLQLVRKLKKYKDNIYKLSPAELAEFIKIKGNFIKNGIVLSDSKLDLQETELINFIRQQQMPVTTDMPTAAGDVSVSDIYNVDVSALNDERVNIRKHLFNDKIVARISKAGRMFSVKWNGKMTSCCVNIPSNWAIDIEYSLLLDLYEEHNTKQLPVNSKRL